MTQPSAAILVVEDEAIIALDNKQQLEGMGYTVSSTVATGAEAIRGAREQKPSLVLMDIKLAGPINGIEAAGIIAREIGTPVVFLTSHNDPDTIQRAVATTPYSFLTKPFQTSELQASIEVALYKVRLERQLKDSELWFASTLRCVSDAVVVTDADASSGFSTLRPRC